MHGNSDSSSVVYRGSCRTIVCAIAGNGGMPANDFIRTQLNGDQRNKFMALFARMGDHGSISNPEKFKHEEDKIYVFKIFRVRMYCFQNGIEWVLTNGCIKKRDKADPAELARAKRIQAEHMAQIAERQKRKQGN